MFLLVCLPIPPPDYLLAPSLLLATRQYLVIVLDCSSVL